MKNTKNRTYGFLYDFWVFVVGESTDVNFTQETKLQYGSLTYHVCNYGGLNSFAFPICDSLGVHYNVLSSYEEEGGTIFIQEKPQSHEHYFCVPWKSEEEIQDIKPITIDFEYRDVLIHFLHDLVNQSPVKKLYVQIRRQGLGRNNMIGMITVDEFGEMIYKDELLGNMVYVIHEP